MIKNGFLFFAVYCYLALSIVVGEPRHAQAPNSSKASPGNVHWGYGGINGPENWGDLSKSYAICKKGRNQSPVNIKRAIKAKLDEIEFNYQNSGLNIVNNGHTIKFNYEKGSFIQIAGEKYHLLQFHFHYKSEHQVKGRHYPMEMHLVHRKDDGGLAVVGVFLEEGSSHKELQKIWRHMPRLTGQTVADNSPINAKALLPSTISYFHYSGSLTTPPCSEGVRWFVIQKPIQVSRNQLNAFKKIFSKNFRPVQPLNHRNVYLR